MKTEWKVDIIKCPNKMGFEMAIYRFDPMGKVYILQDFQKEVELKEGHVFLRQYIPAPVMEAMIEAIHPKEQREEASKLSGKLEATEHHLSDMRQLLKLK